MNHCSNPACPVPPDERRFYRGQSYCVVCSKANATRWIAAHRDQFNARSRARYRRRKRERLAARLKAAGLGDA